MSHVDDVFSHEKAAGSDPVLHDSAYNHPSNNINASMHAGHIVASLDMYGHGGVVVSMQSTQLGGRDGFEAK